MENHRLWYTKPATCWGEALPLGNGRLGAMIYGGIEKEIIQLNEESIHTGKFQDADNPICAEKLPEIRKLLFEGKYYEAQKLSEKYLICKGEGAPTFGAKTDYGSYVSAGEIEINFGTIENKTSYMRELKLDHAVCSSTYSSRTFEDNKEVDYHRETIIPAKENIIITKLTTTNCYGQNLNIKITRNSEKYKVMVFNNELVLEETLNGGLSFVVHVRVLIKNGSIHSNKDSLTVSNATEIIILCAIRSSYFNSNYSEQARKDLDRYLNDYESTYNKHINEHGKLYNSCDIDFCNGYGDNITTDLRVSNVRNGQVDMGLENLFFRYGRYLLISSSRYPGVMPANLQGIWCNDMNPAWNSDWHLNINLQMNYWPAFTTNLSNCTPPLFWLINNLVEPGRKTATVQYNMNGWVVHTLTNHWFFTSPGQEPSWGSYVGATAWLCAHIMEKYRFDQDINFLKENYYIIYEAACFYLDFLILNPNTGFLVTAPSNSPENRYLDNKGRSIGITLAPTMDIELISELFDSIIEVKDIVDEDVHFIEQIKKTKEKLPPIRIDKQGKIAEWIEDFEEAEPGHRHISHLYALFPGQEISPRKTPDLSRAAEETIKKRLANGGQVGWSRAWLACFYARLLKGDAAHQQLLLLLQSFCLDNLFNVHPPFQIDGNLGMTAMYPELLIQSHDEVINILPALPYSWRTGKAHGLKARGNIEIDIKWHDSTLMYVKFCSPIDSKIRWCYKNKNYSLELKGNVAQTYEYRKDGLYKVE